MKTSAVRTKLPAQEPAARNGAFGLRRISSRRALSIELKRRSPTVRR